MESFNHLFRKRAVVPLLFLAALSSCSNIDEDKVDADFRSEEAAVNVTPEGIAKMLSGNQITDAAKNNAIALINN